MPPFYDDYYDEGYSDFYLEKVPIDHLWILIVMLFCVLVIAWLISKVIDILKKFEEKHFFLSVLLQFLMIPLLGISIILGLAWSIQLVYSTWEYCAILAALLGLAVKIRETVSSYRN